MKPKKRSLFFVYQWIIAFPILLVITILVALLTTLLFALVPNSKLSYYPARWWARTFCRLSTVRVKVIGFEKLNLNSHTFLC